MADQESGGSDSDRDGKADQYRWLGTEGLRWGAEVYHRLKKVLAEDVVYFLNAADPASCCGVDVEELLIDAGDAKERVTYDMPQAIGSALPPV